MKTMKFIVKVLVVFLAAGLIFYSCDTNSGSGMGTLIINLPGDSSARAVDLAALAYQIDCVRSGYDTVTRTANSGDNVPITLAVGVWDITVTVSDADGNNIGEQTKEVDIKTGDNRVGFSITLSQVQTYTVTIASGITNGTITASTSSNVQPGTTVRLTISPNTGYQLKAGSLTVTNVDGGGPILVTTDPYSFTMPAYNVIVRGEFELISGEEPGEELYTVTIANTPNGTITANPSGNVQAGTTVTLTVSPDTGYQLKAGSLKFINSDGGGAVNISSTTFTMPAYDVIVSGEFELIPSSNGSISVRYRGTMFGILDENSLYEGGDVIVGENTLSQGTLIINNVSTRGGGIYYISIDEYPLFTIPIYWDYVYENNNKIGFVYSMNVDMFIIQINFIQFFLGTKYAAIGADSLIEGFPGININISDITNSYSGIFGIEPEEGDFFF